LEEALCIYQLEKMFLVRQQRTLGLMMGCQIGVPPVCFCVSKAFLKKIENFLFASN
jgi:hypothetical protein